MPASIIAAMIGAGSAGKPAIAASSPFGADVGSENQFYYGPEDALVRIKPIRVSSEFSQRKAWIRIYGAFAGPKAFIFIDGANSGNVISGTSPVFRTSLDPLNIRLVKLGFHKRRGDRYIVFQGSNSEREIKLDATQDQSRKYLLNVASDLGNGGYAFLYNPTNTAGGFWAGFGQQAGTAVAFDFTVK